jgi:hypothetical protein
MILLQLTNSAAAGREAEANGVVACARALAEAGHEVTLITPAEDRPSLADRRPRFVDTAVRPRSAPPAPSQSRPDLVHVHDPFLVGEEALRLSELHQTPLVFTSSLRYEEPLPLSPAEAGRLRVLVEKLNLCFANRCDVVVAPSAAVAVRLFEGGVIRPIHVVSEDDTPAAKAARLLKLYAETVAKRRARGPVRECGAAGRLRRELALAWKRVHPGAPDSGRGSRGVLAGLRDGSALPC